MDQPLGRSVHLTGVERFFGDDEFIVSKTDIKGRITYANRVFLRVAGYTEAEVLGAPHSIVRHPGMPRAVFKLLWDTIAAGHEIFAYVLNRSKNGDHYWVIAHVTPSFAPDGSIIGYHSNRRTPDRAVLEQTIVPLYKTLLDVEASHPNRKDGLAASFGAVVQLLNDNKVSYDEWFHSL